MKYKLNKEMISYIHLECEVIICSDIHHVANLQVKKRNTTQQCIKSIFLF